MKIIDLLNKIANGEMEEAIFYVNGDFFYYLIVIDNNLYVINTTTKQLEILETKYISRFIRDNVELIRLDKKVEIIEEEPRDIEVCGSLFTKSEYDKLAHSEEEKKTPEKLETYKEVDDERYFANILKVSKNGEYEISEAASVIVDKINEIIDCLDYLKSKGE